MLLVIYDKLVLNLTNHRVYWLIKKIVVIYVSIVFIRLGPGC